MSRIIETDGSPSVPQRAFFSVLSADLARSRDWYTSLFGYRIEFDSDWFVHLQDPDTPMLELGLINRDHEIVDERIRPNPIGGVVTLVVDDVDELHATVVERGIEVIQPPTDLFYGQRRMLIVDPDGQVLDVSSECDPDPEWVATLG
ncbi:MAG: VOC family protein [Actinomycetota bacterium]